VRGRGNILARGKHSWRVKVELPTAFGEKRQRLQVTVRGTKKVAERELTRLLREIDTGVAIAPDSVTVAQHLHAWLWDAPHGLSPKTLERYRQLASQQINPHLGRVELQKLKPAHIKKWHGILMGTSIGARTVGHAHRLLHKAVEDARAVELVSRNVVSAISPPAVEEVEVEILSSAEIRQIHAALDGHWLRPVFVVALATGIRRGELLALRWADIGAKELSVERSLEQTKVGLRFKPPKSRHGRRTVPLPPWAIAEIGAHRLRRLEHCMAIGAGRPELVFTTIHGEPIPPNNLSRDWARTLRAKKLPRVSFHALRHTNASILIVGDRLDILTVSRRLGHRDASITLRVYGHLLDKQDKPDKLAAVLG
jgi:integrase